MGHDLVHRVEGLVHKLLPGGKSYVLHWSIETNRIFDDLW